jgi:hypothetical protein
MTELAQIEQEGPGTGSTEAPEGSGNSGFIFYPEARNHGQNPSPRVAP